MNNFLTQHLTIGQKACLLQQHTEWRLATLEEIAQDMKCDPSVEDVKSMQGKIASMIATAPFFIGILHDLNSNPKSDSQNAELIAYAGANFTAAVGLTNELLEKHPELDIINKPMAN